MNFFPVTEVRTSDKKQASHLSSFLGNSMQISMYELTLNTLLKYLETIHILRQQRTGWVVGSRKSPVLLTFSTVFMLI